MVNRDLLSLKLAELADRIARVRQHRETSLDALAADRDAAEKALSGAPHGLTGVVS
jgi:hypothetical protein